VLRGERWNRGFAIGVEEPVDAQRCEREAAGDGDRAEKQ
jgi:hypothetical protein